MRNTLENDPPATPEGRDKEKAEAEKAEAEKVEAASTEPTAVELCAQLMRAYLLRHGFDSVLSVEDGHADVRDSFWSEEAHARFSPLRGKVVGDEGMEKEARA